jgi:argininosuccinate lyase
VPFREAHGIVAGLVRHALEAGKRLSELGEEELRGFSPELDGEFRELLLQRSWLESKVSHGGTARARVDEQLTQARHVLGEARG